MSVTNEQCSQRYDGNGSTVTPYPISISYSNPQDIFLFVNGDNYTNFTITPGEGFRTNTIINPGTEIVLVRRTPRTQIIAFPVNATPAAEDVTAALNKLTHIVQ